LAFREAVKAASVTWPVFNTKSVNLSARLILSVTACVIAQSPYGIAIVKISMINSPMKSVELPWRKTRSSDGIAPQHRQNNFDFVRLMAASFVLFSHMYALTGKPEPEVAADHSLGNIGLLIFFSISGYLVTLSWLNDPNPLRFLARRGLRIWPALAVIIVLSAFVIAPIFGERSLAQLLASREFFAFLSNLTFIPPYKGLDAFAGLPLREANGSLWTIPIEFLCYIVTAAIVGFRVAMGRWLLPLAMGAAGLYYFAISTGHDPFGFAARHLFILRFISLWFFFAAGALVAVWCRMRIPLPLAAAGLIAGSVLLALGQIVAGLLLALPIAIIAFGRSSWPVIRGAGRLGDFSYGLYLYAWPCQQIVVRVLGTARPVIVEALISLGLALACAVASWYAIERPALRLKPSK
jgi:peptidoglycan/LPS O-acetylase OafA/YrhL